MGFFGVSKRNARPDAQSDPLVKLNGIVPWAEFRPRLQAVWRRPPEAGREPRDAVVMFKALVLRELYDLSELIRRYKVTDAATHDSQAIDDILDDDNTASEVRANSACRSAAIEEKLEDRGLKSRIPRSVIRRTRFSALVGIRLVAILTCLPK